MKEKKSIIIIISVVVGFLILSMVLSMIIRQRSLVPDNEPTLCGTTAGNIYHGGLFCEMDDVVYFSNPYDSGNLYRMNVNQENVEKLVSGEISHINAAGNYLYYYSHSSGNEAGLGFVVGGRGIYRCTLNGQSVTSLNRSTTDGIVVLGSSLYYTNFAEGANGNAYVTLNRMTLNGTDDQMLFEDHPMLGTVQNGTLYFSSMADNYTLLRITSEMESPAVETTRNMYQPIMQNGIIYYLDIHDNYALKSYSIYDGSQTTIVSDRVDSFNVYKDIIYYQNCDPDNYALMRVYTDGTGEEIVRTGAFTNINITSEYVYFTEFGSEIPVYQTPTFGSLKVTTFDAAFRAAANIE